jgi:ATP/maltotriose-dependent transcriptional regulator MalT
MGRSDAERALLETRRRAVALKAVYFEARMNRELAKVAAVQGRLADAVAYIDAAMAVADAYSSRVHEAECLAISARLRAMLGEDERARDEAARAMRLAEDQRMQSHSEIAWNAAVAYALLGDAETAMKLAESAAEGAVRETLGMPADLAEAFLALPWHRDAVDYVWGRPVALGFDAPATTP